MNDPREPNTKEFQETDSDESDVEAYSDPSEREPNTEASREPNTE
jgi:hypothetical protein